MNVLDVAVGECESCLQVRPLHIEIARGEMFAVCDRCELLVDGADPSRHNESRPEATAPVVANDIRRPR